MEDTILALRITRLAYKPGFTRLM